MALREQKHLMPHQRKVCELLARGKRQKEIAYELGVTNGTIRHYVYELLKLTDANTSAELAVMWRAGELGQDE